MNTSSLVENTIRCLSLHQPWATLVTIGAKKIETRSWPTKYRGPLAIHAAKGYPKSAEWYCWDDPFRSALRAGGYDWTHGALWNAFELPLGAILATCRLVNCIRTEEVAGMLSEQERAFGDYTPGRWAWVLADVQPLKVPVPAKGSLGLWSIDRSVLKEGAG